AEGMELDDQCRGGADQDRRQVGWFRRLCLGFRFQAWSKQARNTKSARCIRWNFCAAARAAFRGRHALHSTERKRAEPYELFPPNHSRVAAFKRTEERFDSGRVWKSNGCAESLVRNSAFRRFQAAWLPLHE